MIRGLSLQPPCPEPDWSFWATAELGDLHHKSGLVAPSVRVRKQRRSVQLAVAVERPASWDNREEGEMSLRSFVDSSGNEWQAFDVVPQPDERRHTERRN